MPHLTLSTVGTSLLTNGATTAARNLIFTHANADSFDDITPDHRAALESILAATRDKLDAADEAAARIASAELNGLILDGRERDAWADHYIFLSTDTALGRATAELAAGWLRKQGRSAEVHTASNVQTFDPERFRAGIKTLMTWLANTLDADYRQQGWRVTLNLTGGFKAVNGFLQSAAPLIADEVIYTFERTDALLRIPSLPVRLDPAAITREHLADLRRLDLGLAPKNADALPALLIDRADDLYDLSPYGALIFEQGRNALYGAEIFPSPAPELLVYDEGFLRSTTGLDPKRVAQVNQRIDDLVRHLNGGPNLSRLDFTALAGGAHPRRRNATHECDAWADGSAKRLFLRKDGSHWVLDRLDSALH